jgi:hypothetical protein
MADELKTAAQTDDPAQIKQKLDELEKTLLEVGKHVYAAQQAQQAQQQAPPPDAQGPAEQAPGGDKGYVDADYKIVDDEEK